MRRLLTILLAACAVASAAAPAGERLRVVVPARHATDAARLRWLLGLQERVRRWNNAEAATLKPAEAKRWHRAVALPRAHAVVEAILELRAKVHPHKPQAIGAPAPWRPAKDAERGKATAVLAEGEELDAAFAGTPAEPAELPDPTEDFTTYSKTDPNSRFTVTAGKVACDGLTRQEDARVYRDCGAAHFGATFEHLLDVTPRSSVNGLGSFYTLSNLEDDCKAIEVGGGPGVTGYLYAGKYFYLRDLDDAENDGPWAGAKNSTYYCVVERTGATAIQLRIYSNPNRVDDWEDTLSVTIVGDSFRYLFGCNSWNDGQVGYAASFDVENLDLQEGAAPSGVALQWMHFYKMRNR